MFESFSNFWILIFWFFLSFTRDLQTWVGGMSSNSSGCGGLWACCCFSPFCCSCLFRFKASRGNQPVWKTSSSSSPSSVFLSSLLVSFHFHFYFCGFVFCDGFRRRIYRGVVLLGVMGFGEGFCGFVFCDGFW